MSVHDLTFCLPFCHVIVVLAVPADNHPHLQSERVHMTPWRPKKYNQDQQRRQHPLATSFDASLVYTGVVVRDWVSGCLNWAQNTSILQMIVPLLFLKKLIPLGIIDRTGSCFDSRLPISN